MKNYINPGNSLPMIALAAVTSGDAVLVGDTFGVASESAAIGEEFELKRDGHYTLPCLNTTVASQGDYAYWNNSSKKITAVNTDLKVGVFSKAVLNGDTTAKVVLIPN